MACDAVYIPTDECEDCSSLLARIEALEEALEQKQDKLTAGDGIEIEENVISSVTRAMCEGE